MVWCIWQSPRYDDDVEANWSASSTYEHTGTKRLQYPIQYTLPHDIHRSVSPYYYTGDYLPSMLCDVRRIYMHYINAKARRKHYDTL